MRPFRVVIAGVLFASGLSHAGGQSSTNYTMLRDGINAGIGDTASTNFRLSSAVGSAVSTGTIVSINFVLVSGLHGNAPAASGALTLLSVVSRKNHGAAGDRDLSIDRTPLITGNVTVEPRFGSSGHRIVFVFDGPVLNPGAVTAVNGSGNTIAGIIPIASGNEVVLPLPVLPDASRAAITLSGVNGSGQSITVSIGFLAGDVNNSRSINGFDATSVKARSGQATQADNYQYDLNASGSINATDVSTVKARSGLVLP